jgi:neutral ceramidase
VGVPSGDPSVFRTCTLEEVKAFGRQAAAAVDRALSRGHGAEVRGALQVAQRKFPLCTRVLARAEYEASLSSPHVYEQRWAQDHLAYLDRGETPPCEMVFECQTLVIGRSMAWVAWAGEMTVEYGLRLGRRWGGTFDCVWPLAYANGMVGYVAVDRQLPEGGYEVITCMINHGRSGPLEPGTEGQIHAETDAMLGAAAQAASSA